MALQGMCFSLPTPDDPFNDTLGKKDFKKKKVEKLAPSRADGRVSDKGKASAQRKVTLGKKNLKVKHQKPETVTDTEFVREPKRAKIQLPENDGFVHSFQGQDGESTSCPSKFLIQCLNSIQNALWHNGILDSEEDRPFFGNTWGIEFLKCYTVGRDILETSGSCSTVEQIAWIVSTAADAITRKEKAGLSFSSPFLLYLVPNQETAAKVCYCM